MISKNEKMKKRQKQARLKSSREDPIGSRKIEVIAPVTRRRAKSAEVSMINLFSLGIGENGAEPPLLNIQPPVFTNGLPMHFQLLYYRAWEKNIYWVRGGEKKYDLNPLKPAIIGRIITIFPSIFPLG